MCMKKNKPSSFPSPSVQEQINPYEEATTKVVSPENLSTKSTPRDKTASFNRREVEQGLSVKNTSERHTVVSSQKTKHSPSSLEKEGPSATTTISQTTITLSEEEITRLLQHSRLITSYKEEIQHWCGIVYGNPHALQKKTEEIQRDPSIGEGLSSQIATNPESIHKFAGMQAFGMKSSARKHAEEGLSTLCGLVNCYVEAIKNSRENFSITPQAELNFYEKALGSDAVATILQRPYHPYLRKEALSNDEIADKTRQHPMVKRHKAQIDHWCDIVFSKSDILQSQTEALLINPAMAEELTWQLAAYPQSIGRYAGVNMCGLKNKARKHAESGLSHLLDAVDNYANTIQRVKESFLQVQSISQEHSESSAELAQNLSRSSELSEGLAAIKHPETTEASTQTPEKAQDTRLRKAATSKAMAFAS